MAMVYLVGEVVGNYVLRLNKELSDDHFWVTAMKMMYPDLFFLVR